MQNIKNVEEICNDAINYFENSCTPDAKIAITYFESIKLSYLFYKYRDKNNLDKKLESIDDYDFNDRDDCYASFYNEQGNMFSTLYNDIREVVGNV